jgi:erythromycin esterase-like protein
MYYNDKQSWNLRDTHMFDTLVRVLKHRGQGSKAVVWAHNSHVGDARATSMGWARGELNIGQLGKEVFGQQALSLGCGTYGGTVAAAKNWNAEMEVMDIRPALEGSYEMLAHQTGVDSFWLDLREDECDEELREELLKKRLERFIGVIYRPDTERESHYSTAVLPRQFDGYIWFDQTSAIKPLEVEPLRTAVEFDETYPFGL